MFVTEAFAGSAPAVGATQTETGVADKAGQGAAGVFPPFDHTTFASQLLWLAVMFGLFYLLMQKAIVPRIGSILEDRHGRIAEDLDEASRLNAEADAAVETYEKELAAARAKAGSIASSARDAAKARAQADRTAVEADLAGKLETAEQRIAIIKAQALSDVGAIAGETTVAIVDHLTGASVSEPDLRAAVAAAAQNKGA